MQRVIYSLKNPKKVLNFKCLFVEKIQQKKKKNQITDNLSLI